MKTMKTLRQYRFDSPDAFSLRQCLEDHAECGPGAPRITYVYIGDSMVVGADVEEETLTDGSKAYRINLIAK